MAIVMLLCLVLVVGASAQATNEYADKVETLNIDLSGMATDSGAKVVLKHMDGETAVYTTYPAQYIVKSSTSLSLDFSKINTVTGITYDKYSVIRIQIPSHITSIGEVFGGNSNYSKNLVDVDFSRITGSFSIGQNSFKNCSALEKAILPDNANFGGKNYQFTGCSSLTEARIPNGITAIPAYLFSGCSNLKTVYIPSGVTKVGSNAFTDCNKIVNSVFDCSELTYADIKAFQNCSITFENLNKLEYAGQDSFRSCSGLTSVTFGPNLSLIGSYAFTNNGARITKVTFNGGNYTVGYKAFEGTNIGGPLDLRGCTSVGENGFSGATNITSIILGNEMVSIGKNGFKGCNSPTLITGANLTTIENYGLNLSTTYVYLPDTITSISSYSFNGSGTHFFVTSTDATYISTIKEAVSKDATVITYAQYSANPDNYTSGEYIITGCNKCFAFYSNEHYLKDSTDCTLEALGGKANCTRCGSEFSGKASHALVESISFANGLASNGIYTCECTNEGCSIVDITDKDEQSVINAIFTPLGYSVGPNGQQLKCGYKIDTYSLSLYQRLTGASYGVVMANADTFDQGEFFEDKKVNTDKGVSFEIEGVKYSNFNIDINGFNDTNSSSLRLVIAVYVLVGEKFEIVQFEANHYPANVKIGNSYYRAITFDAVRVALGYEPLYSPDEE